MTEKNYLSLDSSILYRCCQKYFDKTLSEYELGYTHLLLIIQIYENEGISMNELAIRGVFDKGTITKSIQRLEQLNYVRIESNDLDKRSKLLYTSDKARELMPKLYDLKAKWRAYLSSDLSEEELNSYYATQAKLIEKAREYSKVEIESNDIKFYGLQKLTLLDYPGKVAATIFTGACNFRCPFCHNRSLVFLNENENEISSESIMDYLKLRGKILDGVCISGGEPLLHSGIRNFIIEVRKLGLKIKLDTNGSNFELLKQLIEEGLLDYVAMDIKNSKSKYALTIGQDNFDLSEVEKSVNYLLENHIDYEFRTTVVKQFHDVSDFKDIGQWIKGAKHYYLQGFVDHGTCIQNGLEAVDADTIEQMKETVKPYVENVEIRGEKG